MRDCLPSLLLNSSTDCNSGTNTGMCLVLGRWQKNEKMKRGDEKEYYQWMCEVEKHIHETPNLRRWSVLDRYSGWPV